MLKKSRRKTRQCLFQALYSRIYLKNQFDSEFFLDSFFEEDFGDVFDSKYFDIVFSGIIDKEKELCYVIEKFAPKFNINSMPTVNMIPIFIASYEQLFLDNEDIPVKVSIDEALEISKIYSDENARMLINGVLNSLKDKKEDFKLELNSKEEFKNYNLFN